MLHGLLFGQATLLEAEHVLILLALLLQLELLLLGQLLLLRQLAAHAHGALGAQRLLVEAQPIRLAEQRRQLGRIAPVVGAEARLQQIPTRLHIEQIAHALLQDAVHRHPELDAQRQHQLNAAAAAAAIAMQSIPQIVPLPCARFLLIGRPWLQAKVLHLAYDVQSLAHLQNQKR